MTNETPWRVADVGNYSARILDATDAEIAVVTRDERVIGDREDCCFTRDEMEAHAVMLAAAPDLLAALESLLGFCASHTGGGCANGAESASCDAFNADPAGTVESARAAIAKARGEAVPA